MSEDNVNTVTVKKFLSKDEDNNKPYKVKDSSGNSYTTFKDEPFEDVKDLSEGDVVNLKWFENDSGYKTIKDVTPVNVEKEGDKSSDSSESDNGDRQEDYVAPREKQESIQTQKALDKAINVELALSARDPEYGFDNEKVKARTKDLAEIIKETQEEVFD